MNVKSRQALFTTSLAVLMLAGGCVTIPEGYTMATVGGHVIWDSFGQPKLERVDHPESPAQYLTEESPGE